MKLTAAGTATALDAASEVFYREECLSKCAGVFSRRCDAASIQIGTLMIMLRRFDTLRRQRNAGRSWGDGATLKEHVMFCIHTHKQTCA